MGTPSGVCPGVSLEAPFPWALGGPFHFGPWRSPSLGLYGGPVNYENAYMNTAVAATNLASANLG